MPYGMHTWGAQTGPNGEGWKYQYSVDKIRGFQQAHQCSPWMSDYAVYSLMPEVGELVVNEDARASKFSHANEIAKPHYYRVTLDNGITTEMAPTTRGVHLRFTYPRKGDAYLVLDGYFAMSGMKIDPAKRQISGWVNNQRFVNHPETFRNYFVIQFDRPFEEYGLWENEHDERFPGMTEGEGKGYRGLRALQGRHQSAGQGRLVLHQPRAGAAHARPRTGRRQEPRSDPKARRRDVERPAGPHRSRRRHRRGDPHLLFVPVPRQPLLAQVLRTRRRGQSLLLQPLRRQGTRRLHVYRQRFLGYVPFAVPADQHPAPDDAGTLHERPAGGTGAVRLAAIVVGARRDGRHDRQPRHFAADRRMGQRHPHVRPPKRRWKPTPRRR